MPRQAGAPQQGAVPASRGSGQRLVPGGTSRGHIRLGAFPEAVWELTAGLRDRPGSLLSHPHRHQSPPAHAGGGAQPGHGPCTAGVWRAVPGAGPQPRATRAGQGLRRCLGRAIPGQPRKTGPHPAESEVPYWPCSGRTLSGQQADTPGAQTEAKCLGVTGSQTVGPAEALRGAPASLSPGRRTPGLERDEGLSRTPRQRRH